MKKPASFLVSLILIFSTAPDAHPCGPSYVTPLFTTRSSPEFPYSEYAAGRIGIIKPQFHRSVLFAAYRWLNGSGLNAEEQRAMIEVWNAEFRNKDYLDNDVTEAVRIWVEKRKDVLGEEGAIPTIYVERDYGGYDFFPNCTKNAFETATETLSSRIASYGSADEDVKKWLDAQDAVFSNCSSGRQVPSETDHGASEWLQKDRAYQLAAASFYALEYDDAKRRFIEIASDFNSPWQETADYLVARTLVRQASLSKSPDRSREYYSEAEQHLLKFTSGKFADSAERISGLIKYRLRPEERVGELGRKLIHGGGSNFRQDVIDFTWLLDKFEKRVMDEEEQKKKVERPTANSSSVNASNTALNPETSSTSTNSAPESPDPSSSAANSSVNAVTNASNSILLDSEYEGGYYGEETLSLSLLPEFLRNDELIDWLFTYQIPNDEAYLYALNKYKVSTSDLWLMTALSKAKTTSADLNRLLARANNAGRSSPAYPTIAYHAARLNLERGQHVEARKIIDEALGHSSEMPMSSTNEFLKLRFRLAETLDDFLKYSLRKPYAFDFDGEVGKIEEFIEEQKSWYNPEYHTEGKEAYEAEIEKNLAYQRDWQDRLMFDSETINLMNQFFPMTVLAAVESSEALPGYLRERFAIAVWTRAVLFDDAATAIRIAPTLAKLHPEIASELQAVTAAAGPVARQNAALALLVRNPIFTPFLEDGLGKIDNTIDQWDMNDWWCEPYDEIYDDELGSIVSRKSLEKPKFLTVYQNQLAAAEREKLKRIGDAPKYLGEQVLKWAKRSPNDRRIPEALYNMFQANGWTKYGCGNNPDLQRQIRDLLYRRYPFSEWTQKMSKEEEASEQ